jgi:hypothetical protein
MAGSLQIKNETAYYKYWQLLDILLAGVEAKDY